MAGPIEPGRQPRCQRFLGGGNENPGSRFRLSERSSIMAGCGERIRTAVLRVSGGDESIERQDEGRFGGRGISDGTKACP